MYVLLFGVGREKKTHKKGLKQYFHKAWEQNLSSSFLEGWFSINTFVRGAACKSSQQVTLQETTWCCSVYCPAATQHEG